MAAAEFSSRCVRSRKASTMSSQSLVMTLVQKRRDEAACERKAEPGLTGLPIVKGVATGTSLIISINSPLWQYPRSPTSAPPQACEQASILQLLRLPDDGTRLGKAFGVTYWYIML